MRNRWLILIDDDILILIDDSLLGNGGIVITNRRFYFRESFDNSYYREFKDIEYFSTKKLKGFLKAEATLLINLLQASKSVCFRSPS